MKFRRHIGGLVVAGALVAASLISGTASAAGTAQVTVELSSASVATGSSVELRFYVTGAGPNNLFGVEATVNLTNATVTSYDTAGTSFNYASSVGATSGATSFDIIGSYQNPSDGALGKLYIGKAIIAVSSTAGTAQINFTDVQAVDKIQGSFDANAYDSMASSAANSSITITAPQTQTQTCAAGQTGTPPNCVTPVQNNGGTRTNPVVQPNPSNNTTIPSSNNTGAGSQVVSEQDIATVFTTGSADALLSDGAAATTTTKTSKKLTSAAIIAGVAIAVLAVGGLIAMIVARQRRPAPYSSSSTGATAFTSSMTETPPVTSKDNDQSNNNSSGGPTIITPQQ